MTVRSEASTDDSFAQVLEVLFSDLSPFLKDSCVPGFILLSVPGDHVPNLKTERDSTESHCPLHGVPDP